MLNAAIIGFGGIGQGAHVPAWKLLEQKGKARLVAACDTDAERFTQKQVINICEGDDTPADLRTYTDIDEMLANEEIDIIDICLPTYMHAEMAVKMLRLGYAVHSEKPMARTYDECLTMIKASKDSGNELMIGQCLRFSAEYLFLKDIVESRKFGKPLSGVFRRMSSPPVWAWKNWYMNHSKSGGCLTDMHIHDVDMIRFLFGEPRVVSCVTGSIYSEDDMVHSSFRYDGIAVTAIGDWSLHGVEFTHDYRVGFEKATIILENNIVTVYPREGEPWNPQLLSENMYMKELEYFTDLVASGGANDINPPESAAATLNLIEKLKVSSDKNGYPERV